MAAMEPLHRLLGLKVKKLKKWELFLLESDLFIFICNELKEFFRKQYRSYFDAMKFNMKEENDMLDAHLIKLTIKDVIQTGEYDIPGIAYYTDTPVDVVNEVLMELNLDPSTKFFRKLIELHRSVRRELYDAIKKKFILQSLP